MSGDATTLDPKSFGHDGMFRALGGWRCQDAKYQLRDLFYKAGLHLPHLPQGTANIGNCMTQSFAQEVPTKALTQASDTKYGHRTFNPLSLPLSLPLPRTSSCLLWDYHYHCRPSSVSTITLPYCDSLKLFAFDPANLRPISRTPTLLLLVSSSGFAFYP